MRRIVSGPAWHPLLSREVSGSRDGQNPISSSVGTVRFQKVGFGGWEVLLTGHRVQGLKIMETDVKVWL